MMRANPYYLYECKLKKKGIIVYEKADKNRAVAGTLPDNLEVVQLVYATEGLNDNEVYWSVFFYRNKTEDEPSSFLSGFILQSDLDFDSFFAVPIPPLA